MNKAQHRTLFSPFNCPFFKAKMCVCPMTLVFRLDCTSEEAKCIYRQPEQPVRKCKIKSVNQSVLAIYKILIIQLKNFFSLPLI